MNNNLNRFAYCITMLKYYNDNSTIEIGVDEAGRGPLFGRVYSAAVCLPKNGDFDYSVIKDSKRFSNKQKIKQVEELIKEKALYYSISYRDEKVIDKINILQATQDAMHESIVNIIKKCDEDNRSNHKDTDKYVLLIDGTYFNILTYMNDDMLEVYDHVCIKGGDNIYYSIAAASILAKVARDEYIRELCEQHPELKEQYSIDTNKGYGAKKHIEGIRTHGITEWHRKSYAICKDYVTPSGQNIR